MIFLERGPVPALLSGDDVKKEIAALARAAKNANRQRRLQFDTKILNDIRGALLEVSNGKCSYCESSLQPVARGHYDHFRPKAGARGFSNEYAPLHYWWLVYSWDNLLMSCEVCDAKYKRDWFPLEEGAKRAKQGAQGEELLKERALLIDPCSDNPEEHLHFASSGLVSGLTPKGRTSIEILGLNRTELIKARALAGTHFLLRLNSLDNPGNIGDKSQGEVHNYVTELFTPKASQPYAALQRDIFYEWFDRNQALWDSIQVKYEVDHASHVPDPFFSNNLVRESPHYEGSLTKSLAKIEKQLSSIKRFSIKSIMIENFKSIDKIEFSIPAVNENATRESWLLLLGDNGIGKTSILQAVVLALAGKTQLAKMKLDAKDFLKRGTKNGKVIIESFEQDVPIELRFDTKGFYTTLDEPPTFIIGYGPTRLLPNGKIQPERKKSPYLNIANLFDYSIALSDPEEWMLRLPVREFNTKVAPALFDLLALRKDDKVLIKKDGIRIRQYGSDNSLEENSEGYRSVVGLAADIMQTLSLDNANYHNSQGIVFIDEMGNHLHPRWRLKIVEALRKAFPKLQFIVTTHEPLCLRGVSHGEVAVLVRDRDNRIRALDGKSLPDHTLLRIDQLLTSDLFGLINVMDENAEKTYEEYYSLLSKKEEDRTPDEQTRLNEFSNKMKNNEIIGETPQQQVFYKIINETYAEKLRKDGFKTTEVLKQETVDEVKQLISSKKIDW